MSDSPDNNQDALIDACTKFAEAAFSKGRKEADLCHILLDKGTLQKIEERKTLTIVDSAEEVNSYHARYKAFYQEKVGKLPNKVIMKNCLVSDDALNNNNNLSLYNCKLELTRGVANAVELERVLN